ncbi:MAG TPA: hypothetical protein VF668_02700 [Pyrinomonadaceae bacterium]
MQRFIEKRRVELHPSVYLAWFIANREAALAGCACVTPPHVLLGVLKILDDSYDREAEAARMGAGELGRIDEAVGACGPLLQMSGAELTAARRGLHKALPDNNSGERPPRVRMLQWSGDSLFLHQKLVARAMNESGRTITLAHLLEELLENLPPEAMPFFRSHPRARAALDSSGDGQSQAQYDSPLWASSAEPDEE